MTHQRAAKLLIWLLSPLALLGGLVFLFLLFSLFAPSQSSGPWEGEGFSNTDWFAPYFIPTFLVYLLFGLGLWWLLISFAYGADDAFPHPSTLWGLLLGFNIIASFFWIFLGLHLSNPRFGNSSAYLFCWLPLAVTIPVAVMAGRFLFKASR